jgi:outer membrane protein assembly factor BamB
MKISKKIGIIFILSLLMFIQEIPSVTFTTIAVKSDEELSNINSTISSPIKLPLNSSWPMKCHDIRHTSQSPYSTSHITDLEKWRFGCGGVDGGSIIGYDGIIYFGDRERDVYAIYPNGTMKWKYHIEGWITSTPALAEDGTLYIGCWDKKLYALNSSNGDLKWKCGSHGGIIVSDPCIGDDGTIYFGTTRGQNEGEIIAVNLNGTLKWIYPTGDYIYSDPAIGDDGTIYIGSDDSYLYAMNPNGTLKWRFKTGSYIKAPPSIAEDGTIYIGSYDSYLYAINPNGTLKWKLDDAGTSCNPAIGKDGTIYISRHTKFIAINPNGTKKWTFPLGEDRHIDDSSCAISVDGTIYVGASISGVHGGVIFAINPDGTEKWSKTIAREWCESSPCIAEDGTVYIGSSTYGYHFGGYLSAFGPIESNSPPETPMINGETNGKVTEEYWYEIGAVDPDMNPVSFYIDWGDGDEGWTELERASGELSLFGHQWWSRGNYTIRVKAKDPYGEESDWAYLEVTMPHSYNNPFWWLDGLLDRFPLLQRLLEVLIR